MNIIEREIARREAIIDSKTAKEDEIFALEARLDELRAEVGNIDVAMLVNEIEELKEFLPAPEVLDEPADFIE